MGEQSRLRGCGDVGIARRVFDGLRGGLGFRVRRGRLFRILLPDSRVAPGVGALDLAFHGSHAGHVASVLDGTEMVAQAFCFAGEKHNPIVH